MGVVASVAGILLTIAYCDIQNTGRLKERVEINEEGRKIRRKTIQGTRRMEENDILKAERMREACNAYARKRTVKNYNECLEATKALGEG